MMCIISLALKEDDTISVIAEGEDEEKAVNEICGILA